MSGNRKGDGRVIVFFGLTGSGKSYLARSFAEKFRLPYLNTDIERKKLAGIPPTESAATETDAGIYSAEISRKVYGRLLDLAHQSLVLDRGSAVILDGTYQRREERDRVQAEFAGNCELYFIHCYCSEDVTRKRLQRRRDEPDAVSDGTWDVYRLQRSRFEEPTELSTTTLLRLDTDASLEYLIGCLCTFLADSSR